MWTAPALCSPAVPLKLRSCHVLEDGERPPRGEGEASFWADVVLELLAVGKEAADQNHNTKSCNCDQPTRESKAFRFYTLYTVSVVALIGCSFRRIVAGFSLFLVLQRISAN